MKITLKITTFSVSRNEDKALLVEYYKLRATTLSKETIAAYDEVIVALTTRIASHNYSYLDDLAEFRLPEALFAPPETKRRNNAYDEMWRTAFHEWDRVVKEI